MPAWLPEATTAGHSSGLQWRRGQDHVARRGHNERCARRSDRERGERGPTRRSGRGRGDPPGRGPRAARGVQHARRLSDGRGADHRRRADRARAPCHPRRRPRLERGDSGEPDQLASCHRWAIELAAEHGCRRVAFPAISTGVYGYPLELAAGVALGATNAALEAHAEVEEARFWLFDARALAVFATALAELAPRPGSAPGGPSAASTPPVPER